MSKEPSKTPTEHYEEAPMLAMYTFPWTVRLYVDEDGNTIAQFTDAPPGVHLTTHGKDANEALARLNEVFKVYEDITANPTEPKALGA